MSRYRCLVLDHDDTTVQSTPCVHYPSFLDTMHKLRPGLAPLQTEEYFRLWFDSTFERYCRDTLHFTPEEEAFQLQNWHRFVESTVPPFHEGMERIIRRQHKEGALVCVISHSYARYISRDYAAAGLPQPDCIMGWEQGEDKLKPHPYPLEELQRRYQLTAQDILVVDDLKPGYDMAQAFGCDSALALWGYSPALQKIILEGCPQGLPLNSTQALYDLLFSA